MKINISAGPDENVKTITAPGSITTSMQYDVAGNQTQLGKASALDYPTPENINNPWPEINAC